MSTTLQYDAIVIGAGQAGVPLSRALASAGWRTALVEAEHVGGTCINEGCTPTKTMVASARMAYLARRGGEFGLQMEDPDVMMQAVRQRKRDMVNSFRGSDERRLAATAGLELLSGEASFSGPKTVDVRMIDGSARQLAADRIFINAGARPARPRLPGLETVPALDSTTIMELDAVPEHLLVLGGGYVGVEFGQMFRRFGSRVTIVQRAEQLLGREDVDIASEVAAILREDGLDVLLQADALSVRCGDNGQIDLTTGTPQGERTLTGSHLLLAAGRTPNSDRLNLGAAGVATDRAGFITVNERLETNVPGIYALGDIKGGPAFTHISFDDYRIIRDNLLRGGNRTTRDRLVPYVVYMDPQLGRIGLSEQEARAPGRDIRVVRAPMTRSSRASEIGETRGSIKAVIDNESGEILGAAVLAVEGGELMAMLQLAMMGHVRCATLKDTVFAHPSLAEIINTLFESVEG